MGVFFYKRRVALGDTMPFFYKRGGVMDLLPKSRRDAMAKGEGQYLTGKPCIHGHVAYRYTSSGACSACVLDNAAAARQALQPPEALVGLRLRIHPADVATILDCAVSLTQARHPRACRPEHVVGKRVGTKPEGGTLLYVVNVDEADVQLLRDMQFAMLQARGPNLEQLRAAAFGAAGAQAEAARDNGETEWKFT